VTNGKIHCLTQQGLSMSPEPNVTRWAARNCENTRQYSKVIASKTRGAVKKAAPSPPLVMIAVGDPVGTDLIKSLAHPGGNITGLTSIASDLEGKRLELLREVLPQVSHVAVLWNPASPFQVVSEVEGRLPARRPALEWPKWRDPPAVKSRRKEAPRKWQRSGCCQEPMVTGTVRPFKIRCGTTSTGWRSVLVA